jgi:hypothetical protein
MSNLRRFVALCPFEDPNQDFHCALWSKSEVNHRNQNSEQKVPNKNQNSEMKVPNKNQDSEQKVPNKNQDSEMKGRLAIF